MTQDEFAQSIKDKYPQYQSMSNQDLSSKMLAKYPQYQSQIEDTPNTISNTIANSGALNGFFGIGNIPGANKLFGNLVGGAVRPIEKLANRTFGLVNQGVDAMTGKQTQSVFDPSADTRSVGQQAEQVAGSIPKAAITAATLGTGGSLPEIVHGSTLAARGLNAAVQGGIVGAGGGFGYSPTGQEIPSTVGGAAVGALLNPIFQALTSGGITSGGASKQMKKVYNSTSDTTSWSDIGTSAQKRLGTPTVGEKQALDRIGARFSTAPAGEPAINIPPTGPAVPALNQVSPNEMTATIEPTNNIFTTQTQTGRTINPSGAVGQNQLNASDAWALRQKIDDEIKWNAVNKGNVLPDEQKALLAFRGALNDWLDKVAPNALPYRNALALYNKSLPIPGISGVTKGDVPTRLAELGGAGALFSLFKNLMGGNNQ